MKAGEENNDGSDVMLKVIDQGAEVGILWLPISPSPIIICLMWMAGCWLRLIDMRYDDGVIT